MRTDKFILAALTALVLGACSNDNEPQPQSSFPEDGQVRITAGINDIVTRAGVDNTNITGKEIGFFFTTPDNTKYTYANRKLTHNGSEWAADENMYWADKTTEVTVIAYVPWEDRATSGSRLNYITADDQSTPALLEAADRVYVKRTVNPATTGNGGLTADGKIDLPLRHILSKIRLTLTIGTDITDETPDAAITTVVIKNLIKYGTIKLSDGTAAEHMTNTATVDITPCATDGSYEAIFLPQTVSSGQLSVEVTLSTGKTYVYTLSSECTFAANTLYKLPIQVGTSTPNVTFTKEGITSDSWGTDNPLGDKITD